jgi:hypothetical protein
MVNFGSSLASFKHSKFIWKINIFLNANCERPRDGSSVIFYHFAFIIF